MDRVTKQLSRNEKINLISTSEVMVLMEKLPETIPGRNLERNQTQYGTPYSTR